MCPNDKTYADIWKANHPGYFAKRTAEYVKQDPVRWTRIRVKALDKKRSYVLQLKKKGKCTRCAIKDFRVLEWAHKRGTIKIKKAWVNLSWPGLLSEIKKCILLCANCHRVYDWKERQKQDKAKKNAIWGRRCHQAKIKKLPKDI